jgi:transcriptional regulator with XRE-family HTH domain
VGARIRSLREARALTQVEIAKALGITQSNVSAIERGARSLTVHQVVKLSKALGASADDILSPAKAAQAPPTGVLADRRFLRRLQKLDRLTPRDQQALLRTLDAFLTKAP